MQGTPASMALNFKFDLDITLFSHFLGKDLCITNLQCLLSCPVLLADSKFKSNFPQLNEESLRLRAREMYERRNIIQMKTNSWIFG